MGRAGPFFAEIIRGGRGATVLRLYHTRGTFATRGGFAGATPDSDRWSLLSERKVSSTPGATRLGTRPFPFAVDAIRFFHGKKTRVLHGKNHGNIGESRAFHRQDSRVCNIAPCIAGNGQRC